MKVSDITSIDVTDFTGTPSMARGTLSRNNGDPLENVTMQFTGVGGWERPGQQGARRILTVRQIRSISFEGF